MTTRFVTTTDKLRAQSLNRTGLEHYERWEMESAITLFQEAVRLDDTEPDYHLNLARAQVRMGDYELILHALGDYIRTEKDKTLVSRFEALFSNALDPVLDRPPSSGTASTVSWQLPVCPCPAAEHSCRIGTARRRHSVSRKSRCAGRWHTPKAAHTWL